MMQPTWFDEVFATVFERATAKQILDEIARCPRIIEAVTTALERFEQSGKEKGQWVGPSRTQVVRTALVEVLERGTLQS